MKKIYSALLFDSLASGYIESKIAGRASAYYGISMDLRRVIEVCNRLSDLLRNGGGDSLILESLTWHAVVLYGRCFDSQSAGRGGASLHNEDVQSLGSKESLELHNGLIARRHGTFAHAGPDCSFRAIMHLMPRGDAEPGIAITYEESTAGPIVDADQSDAIAKLCHDLLAHSGSRGMKAEQVMIAELEADSTAIERLQQRIGSHASPEQQTVAMMMKISKPSDL